MSVGLPSAEGITGARGLASQVAHLRGRQVSAGSWQEASGLCHTDPSKEMLESPYDVAAGFPQREWSTTAQRGAAVSFAI